jgi:hypothetical protein
MTPALRKTVCLTPTSSGDVSALQCKLSLVLFRKDKRGQLIQKLFTVQGFRKRSPRLCHKQTSLCSSGNIVFQTKQRPHTAYQNPVAHSFRFAQNARGKLGPSRDIAKMGKGGLTRLEDTASGCGLYLMRTIRFMKTPTETNQTLIAS